MVNFAHPDMVAHTGNLAASIKACEAADRSLAKIIPEALSQNTSIIITGDHGNAEELIDTSTNKPDTEHSTAPVPFIYVDNSVKGKSKSLPAGILADVSPTILAILGIPKPTNMVGRNLLENF